MFRFRGYAGWLKTMPQFGVANGLLSEDELSVLMSVVYDYAGSRGHTNVLEVGHYYGLSTAALCRALQASENDWHLTSVDAHEPDGNVPEPAPWDAFLENVDAFCKDERIVPLKQRSQDTDLADVDVVFYDGDHGREQVDFAHRVQESKCELFVFDDADWPKPVEARDFLLKNGWREIGPPRWRSKGNEGHTKSNPRTMTLAVLTREVPR